MACPQILRQCNCRQNRKVHILYDLPSDMFSFHALPHESCEALVPLADNLRHFTLFALTELLRIAGSQPGFPWVFPSGSQTRTRITREKQESGTAGVVSKK